MQVAVAEARAAGLQVVPCAATFAEDVAAIPPDFLTLPVLTRSVLDCVDRADTGRKLPLLEDILLGAFERVPDADYLIYSNIDIGLWPDFYQAVAGLLAQGADALCIGRRTIELAAASNADLKAVWAEEGVPHWGLSCFVFPRSHYPDYVLEETCIGLQPVGVTLALNMIQRARRFENHNRLRLTFHIGDERPWSRTLLDPCHLHNERAMDRVLAALRRLGPLKRESRQLFREYQRWRAGYVIDVQARGPTRHLYRALRRVGLVGMVARRYGSSADPVPR